MGAATTIALCFSYPNDERAGELRSAVAELADGKVRSNLERFVGAVEQLPLGEWEELHTRTLDLSPQFVPYVGHVVWGESYKRGAFMAELKRAMVASGVDLDGELPDHLAPILRYLEASRVPHEELVEVLPKAVTAMSKELKKSDATNPYRHVLAAARAQVAIESRVEIGGTHARQ